MIDALVLDGSEEPGFQGKHAVEAEATAVQFQDDVLDDVLGRLLFFHVFHGKYPEDLIVFLEENPIALLLTPAKLL